MDTTLRSPHLVMWKDAPIGAVTATGKILCKQAFGRLRHVDRIRAYLLMVWPARRRSRAIGAVCGVSPKAVGNFLKPDLRDGVVERDAYGYRWRRAVPVCVDTERAGGGDTKGGDAWPHSANGA